MRIWIVVLVALFVAVLPPAAADGEDDWLWSTTESPTFGFAGDTLRFNVRSEAGLGIDPDDVAADVLRALDDHRSWIALEPVRFQLTTDNDVDFTFSVASPSTTDVLCAPLRTLGRLSCRRGRNVVANADRWGRGPDVYHSAYDGDLATYRLYLVNHEVGHFIGKGHVFPSTCSESRRAPVMMQQTFGMRGCANNGWPAYDLRPIGVTATVTAAIGPSFRFAERRVRLRQAASTN